MLKKRREQKRVSKRQKERRQLLRRSLKHLESHHDLLWHQTPTMGIEGLIATIDSREELRRAIKMQIEKSKEMYRRESSRWYKNSCLDFFHA
jgi:hypothetical protein